VLGSILESGPLSNLSKQLQQTTRAPSAKTWTQKDHMSTSVLRPLTKLNLHSHNDSTASHSDTKSPLQTPQSEDDDAASDSDSIPPLELNLDELKRQASTALGDLYTTVKKLCTAPSTRYSSWTSNNRNLYATMSPKGLQTAVLQDLREPPNR
jgi:hypothetical protein